MTVSYSLREVEGLLSLSKSVVSKLIGAGFVTPRPGTRGEWRFDFVDLMLLRTASSLQMADIPPRKILAALSRLREQLPEECPITGLRVTAVGADVAVNERGLTWAAETGQLMLDFEVAQVNGTVAILPRPVQPNRSASDWVDYGRALEQASPLKAEAAYRNAIDADASLEDAYLNLGALLCDLGRCGDAIEVYQSALKLGHSSPSVYFNLALAQEDREDLQAAMDSYKRCIAAAPGFSDAYFNLARLEQNMGDTQAALRHLAAYRRFNQAPV